MTGETTIAPTRSRADTQPVTVPATTNPGQGIESREADNLSSAVANRQTRDLARRLETGWENY